jgi:outer membrane protein
MKMIKYPLAALLFFAACLNVSSQETLITLDQAIRNAYKNNVSIVKTEYNIDAQESNIRNRYGNLFPDLKFSTGWQRSNTVNEEGVQTINGIEFPRLASNFTRDYFSLSLRSDVTLFDGLVNMDRIDLAERTKVQYQIQLQKLKQDVTIRIMADYITVLKNQQIVLINEAQLEDSRAQLERIKIFVEVGRRTLTDIYQQDVLVAQNELAVEQSKNNLNKSLSDLAFNSNLPLERNYAVNQNEFNTNITFDEITTYVNNNSNTDALVTTAYKNRYDYKASVQYLDIYQTNIDIARGSQIFPTITGFGQYSLNGEKIGQISDQRVFSIGLTLSYPIFQNFTIDNQRQQAEISYKIAQEDVKLVKDQIALDIKKALLDLRSLTKQIEITDRSLANAEQNKLLAEESYRVGIGTILDVNTASINLNNLLITKSNLIYDFILAQKQLEYYQGILQY